MSTTLVIIIIVALFVCYSNIYSLYLKWNPIDYWQQIESSVGNWVALIGAITCFYVCFVLPLDSQGKISADSWMVLLKYGSILGNIGILIGLGYTYYKRPFFLKNPLKEKIVKTFKKNPLKAFNDFMVRENEKSIHEFEWTLKQWDNKWGLSYIRINNNLLTKLLKHCDGVVIWQAFNKFGIENVKYDKDISDDDCYWLISKYVGLEKKDPLVNKVLFAFALSGGNMVSCGEGYLGFESKTKTVVLHNDATIVYNTKRTWCDLFKQYGGSGMGSKETDNYIWKYYSSRNKYDYDRHKERMEERRNNSARLFIEKYKLPEYIIENKLPEWMLNLIKEKRDSSHDEADDWEPNFKRMWSDDETGMIIVE